VCNQQLKHDKKTNLICLCYGQTSAAFFGDCLFYFVCEDEKVVNFHATFTVIKCNNQNVLVTIYHLNTDRLIPLEFATNARQHIIPGKC